MEEHKVEQIEVEKVISNEEKKDWLKQEAEEIKQTSFDGERKPALQLQENKTVNLTIDFSHPFEKWEDTENNTIKKIIPVKVMGEDLVWWLNVRNPIYGQIVERGLQGQTEFKVLQTGSQKSTKYILVED